MENSRKKAFLSGMGGNAFCWTVTIKLSIRNSYVVAFHRI